VFTPEEQAPGQRHAARVAGRSRAARKSARRMVSRRGTESAYSDSAVCGSGDGLPITRGISAASPGQTPGLQELQRFLL